MEEIKAVQTRAPSMNFDVSNRELIAKMKELCERGYKEITTAPLAADDCYDVLEYMLTAIEADPTLKQDGRGQEKKLNLRLLVSGFRFLALSKMEQSVDWRAMLLSQMKQQIGASKRTRRERIKDEKEMASELLSQKFATQHDKLAEWCRMTGRDLSWVDLSRDSAEYAKGFRAAKMDLQRKRK